MKLKLEKNLALFIAAMFLLSILPAYAGYPGVPHDANAMWIEGPYPLGACNKTNVNITTADLGVGEHFKVTVWLNISSTPSGNNLVGSWQFYMKYDNTILNATDCYFTNETAGKSQFFEITSTGIYCPPAYGPDSVMFGEMVGTPVQDNFVNVPRHGSLAWVEFEILKAPEKYAEILSLIDISTMYPDKTWVMDDVANICPMTVSDCVYHYRWAPPVTNPHMAVDPLSKTFDKYTNHTCELFNVSLNIVNLDGAWGLTNVSFTLTYNETFLAVRAVYFDTAVWNQGTAFVNGTGALDILAKTDKALYAPPPVTVAKVTFHLIYHPEYPPDEHVVPLVFEDVLLYDHFGDIPTPDPDENGEVIIQGIITLPVPYLEVVPNHVILGPGWVEGDTFKVEIMIKNLHFGWNLIAWESYLDYCPDLLEPLPGEEGPYLKSFPQNPDPPQTFFICSEYIDFLSLGGMILPNRTAVPPAYTDPLPGAEPPEDGVVAILTFKVLKQSCCEDYTCDLTLRPMDGDLHFFDKEGTAIPYDEPVHGKVTVQPWEHVGRQIDVYTQYPAPYGGQGPDNPSDMFWPQKEVILYASVTYNFWPVQQKLVTFTVSDNKDTVWTKLQGVTDEYGVASASFRLPWPCDNPEQYLGVWRVVADVDIACVVVIDELEFHYDYLVADLKVTTDKDSYYHCDDVVVTVTFNSHAQQTRTVAIRVTIHDELNVPIASDVLIFDIGGAGFCTAEEYEKIFTLHVDKFAAAGWATVYAIPTLLWNGEWVAAGPADSAIICIFPA